tara:strand:+ start:164 stop:508 length:345 start_codon:yes stop_codon:yes gene_type:complete
MTNKNARETLFLKYLLGFQFLSYFFISSCIFLVIFIYPLINDFLSNGFSSITDKYVDKVFSNNYMGALNVVFADWKTYLNPLSNFFIRFFLAAAIFSIFFEKTKKCFIDFKKIK